MQNLFRFDMQRGLRRMPTMPGGLLRPERMQLNRSNQAGIVGLRNHEHFTKYMEKGESPRDRGGGRHPNYVVCVQR